VKKAQVKCSWEEGKNFYILFNRRLDLTNVMMGPYSEMVSDNWGPRTRSANFSTPLPYRASIAFSEGNDQSFPVTEGRTI
jgi:hypothetical protein